MSTIAGSVGKGGSNKKPDVRAVQCLLNLNANMVPSGRTTKLTMNGTVDKATQDAIDLFQAKVLKLAKPDGRVDARGGMIRRLEQALGPMPSGPFNTPRWLAIAHGEEGIKESGTGTDLERRVLNSPRILEYLGTAAHLAKVEDTIPAKGQDGKPLKDARGKPVKQATGYKLSEVDETAWCACFVNWCLDQANEPRIKGAKAELYNSWGVQRDEAGAITVIYREPFNDSASGFHVGFYVGGSPRDGYVALLGGNQNNSVCRKWFVGIEPRYIWQRWPG
jgi:uncharacterized protein (TIGR02594 family)